MVNEDFPLVSCTHDLRLFLTHTAWSNLARGQSNAIDLICSVPYLGNTYRIVSVAPLPFGGLSNIMSPFRLAAIMALQQLAASIGEAVRR